MIRTFLIGAVFLGSITATAVLKPILLVIAAGVVAAGILCLGFGFMIEDLFGLDD
jgi:hypothetical protein